MKHHSLWDTAGQEEFASLRPLAYEKTDILLIAFSIAKRPSFQNVREVWHKEVQTYKKNFENAQVKFLPFIINKKRFFRNFPSLNNKVKSLTDSSDWDEG